MARTRAGRIGGWWRSLSRARRSVLATFALSYLAVLAVPLAIGSSVYRIARNVILQEVVKTRSSMMRHAAAMIDTDLSAMTRTSMLIGSNPEFALLAARTQPFDADATWQVFRIIRGLSPFLTTDYQYLRNARFFIYYLTSDVIVTPTAMYPARFFYETTFSYPGVSFEQWRSRAREGGYPWFRFISEQVLMDGNAEGVISLVQPLPTSYAGSAPALVFVLLNESKVTSVLADVALGGAAFLLDRDDRLVTCTPSAAAGFVASIEDLPPEGVADRNIRGTAHKISWIRSPDTGMKYVTVVPTAVFVAGLGYFGIATGLIAAVCILAGLALVVVLARRNYGPVRRIFEILRADRGPEKGDAAGQNELEYIRSAVGEAMQNNRRLEARVIEVLRENTEIRRALQNSSAVVRNHLILQFVRSDRESASRAGSWLELNGVRLPHRRFVVACVRVERILAGARQAAGGSPDWVRFAICSALQEHSVDLGVIEVATVDDRSLVILLNVADSLAPETVRSEVHRVLSSLESFVQRQLGIDITIGVGGVSGGRDSLRRGYDEASKALAYKIVRGSGVVIHFDEIEEAGRAAYHYPIDTELHLINHIKDGDAEQCGRILEDIFNENLHRRNLSPDLVRCLFFDVLSTILKTLDDMELRHLDVFPEGTEPVDLLLRAETTEEFYANVRSVVQDICWHVRQHKDEPRDRLKRAILDHIDRHFADSTLTQTSVAESIGISPQYLSRFFKREMKVNMMDHIHRLRIDYAKRLICETKLSLESISKQAGYASDRTFSRMYKQYESITPGRFRSIARDSQRRQDDEDRN